MRSYSLKSCASGVIKFQLHLDFDDLCLKEIKTSKINSLKSTFDQTKQKVTRTGPTLPLLKPKHKSIQTKQVTEAILSEIIVCTKTQNRAQLRFYQSQRKNDSNKLKILNTNWFEDLHLLNQRNPISYHGQALSRKRGKA